MIIELDIDCIFVRSLIQLDFILIYISFPELSKFKPNMCETNEAKALIVIILSAE